MGFLGKLRATLRGAAAAAPARHGDDRARAIASIDEGNALEEGGDLDAAFERYRQAQRTAPTLARAHLNLGNVYLARGDAAAALAAYETAIEHEPKHHGAHFNRGNALAALGRLNEALAAWSRAAEIAPDFADAHVARGAALHDVGRSEEAVAAYRAALALQPDYAPVHSNLGIALHGLTRFDEAVACQRRALALDPNLVQAWINLGNSLKDVGRLDEAEASYRRACSLQPDDLESRSNLLFCQAYRQAAPPEAQRAAAEQYGQRAASQARRFEHWAGTRDPERPLRVGFVSGDLRHHPVGHFLESAIDALVRGAGDRLHLVAYASAPAAGGDEVAARLRSAFHAWHDVAALPVPALAELVHDCDRIDVLVDLSGHTAHTRLPLFACKPSPVQVSWLGWFGTTGVAEIDWFLADPVTLPPRFEPHFTERVWRLPETRLCFSAPRSSPPVVEPPSTRGGQGGITFGCFNHIAKMNDGVVALWARVLAAVPGSRLLLKSPPLESAAVRDAVSARFTAHGVAAGRVSMEGLSSRTDYLIAHGRVDIALDPFPYPGGTTTVEALWMGVPVLTLAGDSFLARQGAGLLINAGLDDWVVASSDDYVRVARERAADPGALALLRRQQRTRLQASPVMDAARFAAHFEAALRGIWQAWCADSASKR